MEDISVKEYLCITNKFPNESNQYAGWESDLELIKQYNKKLVEEFHWLLPKNRFSGKVSEDYDYTYTELDAMPDGWRIAFGMDMCKEINNELIKFNYQDKYTIAQIKEKFGGLRWYDNGAPVGDLELEDIVYFDSYINWNMVDKEKYHYSYVDKTDDNKYAYKKYLIKEKCLLNSIIGKYENMSYNTCIICGEPAKWISRGWISPFCDNCKSDKCNYVDINEFYAK